MDEFCASLALRHTTGLGPRTWKRLLAHYGDALAAASDFASWTARGLVSARVQAEFARGGWREKAEAERRRAESLGFSTVFFGHRAYPELLREIPDPPLFLYYLGDLALLTRPCVAVVGSRDASRYGLGMAESMAASLSAAGICVVSGFAQGIDRAAHQGALRGVGGTIAVLGTGLDLVYPASNADLWKQVAAHGLIVSEFAPGTRPEGMNFPHRNRIVSGLSLGVLVVEGALGSGSLITAELALAQNRDVFALPGPANLKTYQGCHQLIRQGACLVQSGEDILRELQPRLGALCAPEAPAPEPRLREPEDPEQCIVHRLLEGGEPLHVDTLIRRTGWAASKVSSTLLFMELQGIVKQLPGMYYALAT
ncbi:MAG: DNA-protecting protein DprA [Deltaproteobacteria bacterium HGW-Deltaproteobacteria-18]|nr:MAG: DNA-protecting protein DprA [Deltaproteobacteria bacterium HGW-Deltaproteobacteria-18]